MKKLSPSLDDIKRQTIIALVSDDELLERLVLKGGNALRFGYQFDDRASKDLDFSMKNDFAPEEIEHFSRVINNHLKTKFRELNLIVFDYKFEPKPKKKGVHQPDFWGGYAIEFKVLSTGYYQEQDEEHNRRHAGEKITVDISKYEYCDWSHSVLIDDYTVYIYSLRLIVYEKLRAICQQTPEYRQIIKSQQSRARPRDFYDIYQIMEKTRNSFQHNFEELKLVFEAKQVPIEFLRIISRQDQFDLHHREFESLRQTVPNQNVLAFKVYFDYIINLIDELSQALGIE